MVAVLCRVGSNARATAVDSDASEEERPESRAAGKKSKCFSERDGVAILLEVLLYKMTSLSREECQDRGRLGDGGPVGRVTWLVGG